MLFLVRNAELVKNREKTYLTSATSSSATTLTVRAVDSNAWADNDWIIVGEIGTKTAEILQVNGAVSDGTSLTVDNAGSGGARYAHSIDEPVYRVDYNRVEFSRNTTDTTTGVSVLATNEVQPDDQFTRYEDTVNSTGYGFVRFNNSLTSVYSSYSDGIAYSGYTSRSLGKMISVVRRRLGENSFEYVDDDDIVDELNEKQRDIAHERLWPFYEDTFSSSTIAYQQRYSMNSNVVTGKAHSIVCRSEPLDKINTETFDILHWDTSRTGEPTHYRIWGNAIEIYPLVSSAAQTTTLNGALSATATSITVVSTSGFSPSGRIIIDSEVISYTNTSSTQFRGCIRGLEETTAATHTDTTTVTERDIVYTANREPENLVDIADETEVPDPNVLIDGASMELALGKLKDQALHDRLQIKYSGGLDRLRDKFGQKGTSMYFKIKDKEETVSGSVFFRSPMDFPQNLS